MTFQRETADRNAEVSKKLPRTSSEILEPPPHFKSIKRDTVYKRDFFGEGTAVSRASSSLKKSRGELPSQEKRPSVWPSRSSSVPEPLWLHLTCPWRLPAQWSQGTLTTPSVTFVFCSVVPTTSSLPSPRSI